MTGMLEMSQTTLQMESTLRYESNVMFMRIFRSVGFTLVWSVCSFQLFIHRYDITITCQSCVEYILFAWYHLGLDPKVCVGNVGWK